jgi:site-specific DNA-methyltransferase (adenine-specific)
METKLTRFSQDPENLNKGTDKGRRMLSQSIQDLGAGRSILVDRNGVIIAGNKTAEAAIAEGLEDAIVVQTQGDKVVVVQRTDLDLTKDPKAKQLAIADNRIAEIDLSWDAEALQKLAEEVDLSWLEVDDNFFEELEAMENEELEPEQLEPLTDEDDIPDEEDVETRVKKGDIWQLGRHRVMCGDSAVITDVERLMDGRKADMVFTDPPYGVAYKGKTKDALEIENDDVSEDDLSLLVTEWFNGVDIAARDGCYLMATVPPGPLHLIFALDWKSRGWLRQIMVWNKSAMVMGHSEYHYKHEPILFGWKPGGGRHKNTDRTKTTVWEFDKPSANRIHPTMKPVAMWEYGIINHTNGKDLFYEPFLGSGTTLIACEKTGRTCYGMELSEKYCDVILKRWEDFTGKAAVRINDTDDCPNGKIG